MREEKFDCLLCLLADALPIRVTKAAVRAVRGGVALGRMVGVARGGGRVGRKDGGGGGADAHGKRCVGILWQLEMAAHLLSKGVTTREKGKQ